MCESVVWFQTSLRVFTRREDGVPRGVESSKVINSENNFKTSLCADGAPFNTKRKDTPERHEIHIPPWVVSLAGHFFTTEMD